MDEFLTVAEVADMLKMNQQTIRNWIDAGQLPAVRAGRRVRILSRDLIAHLEKDYNGTEPIDAPPKKPNEPSIWEGFIPDPVEPKPAEPDV